MIRVDYRFTSSMEKCFHDQPVTDFPALTAASALRGELYSFQLVFRARQTVSGYGEKQACFLRVESPLKDCVSAAWVESVPVRYPVYKNLSDDNYLRYTPGLYPDLLVPITESRQIYAAYEDTRAIWIDVDVAADAPAGDCPITLSLVTPEGETVLSDTFTLTVIPALLPKQKLIRTEWFHGDCLADYYGVPVFSGEHWRIMENFIRTAVKNGINMILTPVFTPPLDTAVGGERTTIQLTDVFFENGVWRFSFDRLGRWIDLCLAAGVEYIEISHFFTQWGAKHAPKIMAHVNGEEKKVFGWETDSLGKDYRAFLDAFLPALLSYLKEKGVVERCRFHVSDVPRLSDLENYRAARAILEKHLPGCIIMDALSNIEFYKNGAISNPIPGTKHIEPFLKENIPNLWAYYCCTGCQEVSNRFVAMPGARTRILGIQLYKFNIKGFLHWGYNFYNCQFSLHPVNPYLCTDGEYFAPAGDMFSVYPAPDGTAWETLHLRNVTSAMYDLRALQLCESLVGREEVLRLIEGDLPLEEKITFFTYPKEASYLLTLREKLHARIAEAVKKQ